MEPVVDGNSDWSRATSASLSAPTLSSERGVLALAAEAPVPKAGKKAGKEAGGGGGGDGGGSGGGAVAGAAGAQREVVEKRK